MNIPKPNVGWVKHSKDGLQQVQVIFDHAEAIWLAKAPLMAQPAFSDCKSAYWKLVNRLMVVYTNQNTWTYCSPSLEHFVGNVSPLECSL